MIDSTDFVFRPFAPQLNGLRKYMVNIYNIYSCNRSFTRILQHMIYNRISNCADIFCHFVQMHGCGDGIHLISQYLEKTLMNFD